MRILMIILLVAGWVALLACAGSPLLSAIQFAAVGLGLLVCALICALRLPPRAPKLPPAPAEPESWRAGQ